MAFCHHFAGPALTLFIYAEAILIRMSDSLERLYEAVIKESADLLYNLTVLWVAAGIQPKDVWAEMNRRERLFGIAEKLPKRAASLSRRKVVALAVDGVDHDLDGFLGELLGDLGIAGAKQPGRARARLIGVPRRDHGLIEAVERITHWRRIPRSESNIC